MLKLTNDRVRQIKSNQTQQVSLDDLLRISNFTGTLGQLEELNLNEVEVTFTDRMKEGETLTVTEQFMKQVGTDKQQTYVMKMVEHRYMGGKHSMKLLAFRRNIGFLSSGSSPPLKNNNVAETEMTTTHGKLEMQDEDIKSMKGLDAEAPSSMMELNFRSSSSRSSSTSSMSSTFSVLTNFTSHLNSKVTPKTLKFILNLSSLVFLVMIVASTVILSITLQNQKEVTLSISICNYSLKELNGISTMRLLLRSMLNIYQGDEANSGRFMADRLQYYANIVDELNENVRLNQVNIDRSNALFRIKNTDEIDVNYVSANG